MSRVDGLLKEYRGALDSAHRRASGTGNSLNDPATLDVVEHMILDFVDALLQDLGETSIQEEGTEEMIQRASSAVREHRERFADRAPVEFLAREISGLYQALRDIAYLREGLGRGSKRPKPSDMKWSNGRAVEGFVRDTVRQVAAEIKSDGAENRLRSTELSMDLAATHDRIVELLDSDFDAATFMQAAIDLGQSQISKPDWDEYRDLPFEQELDERSSFFLEVVEREPPASPLTGFGVEIAYPIDDGETIADLWLMGGVTYQPDDETWLDLQDYLPRDNAVHSEVLAAIYRMAYAPGGLGNAADYTLCLAWGGYFSRSCAYRYLEETGVDRIGLRVGFGGGDWIDMGWLRGRRTAAPSN